MQKWLRRIRGVVGMGVTWAIGWALVGLLIGVTSVIFPGLPWHYFFDVFDAPLPALAMPGFLCGALYSTVLGIAGRHHRFDQLSLPRVAVWGAVGGLLLGLVPAAMVTVGLATLTRGGLGLWQLTAVLSGPLMLLSAASASGSLLLARMSEHRAELEAGEDVADAGLTDGDARELLGRGR